MKCLRNGTLITESGLLTGQRLLFDSLIRAIEPDDGSALPDGTQIIDAKGGLIAPGLVNLHIHGCMNKDTSDGTNEALHTIARHLLATGVTSFCPTLCTVEKEQLDLVAQTLRCFKESPDDAHVLGLYLEGIFLSHAKKGAHREDWLMNPDASLVLSFKDILRLVICAPELPGAEPFIRTLTENGIIVAVGHSNATYEQAIRAYRAGATDTTHLFNAMSGLSHRQPGVAEAALSEEQAYTELICDNFHVHPAFYSLVYRLKKDHLIFITDSISPAGCPDGSYIQGGLHVTKTGKTCLLDDGTIAGSVADLLDGLKNVHEATDIPLHDIFNAASLNPCRLLKIDDRKGSLAVGKDADILLLDNDLTLQQVFKA